jgi:hypothetical protein
MFAAENYTNIYVFALLALTLVTALLFLRGSAGKNQSEYFSSVMAPTICVLTAVFLGTRPVSGVFIDMATYDVAYKICSVTGESNFPDWAFSSMMIVFSKYFGSDVFFFACSLIYLLPLLWIKRVHGDWGYAVILACIGAFSFFSYGVNVIRHGMAASLLIAALCNHDRKWLMLLLGSLSIGMHQSMAIPMVALLVALFLNSSFSMWACWLGWLVTLFLSRASGGGLSDKLMSIALFGNDERFVRYATGIGNDKGGFRWDFIAYSITPVLISFALAGSEVRRDRIYRVLIMAFLLTNSFWLLVIYAAYSDRFAYLSWFILPWIITYPFTPRKIVRNSAGIVPVRKLRLGLLAAALLAHFAFTFFMYKVYYNGVI